MLVSWGILVTFTWRASPSRLDRMFEGGVRLEERSKGLSHSVIMAWPTMFWLLVAWDSLTPV